MKKSNYFIVLLVAASFIPSGFANANINMGIEASTEVRIAPPGESKLDLRRLDLQKRLFKEEVSEKRAEFQKSKEAFKNSTSDTRNIMRSEFRAKFAERFKFTIDKLSEFQTRTEAKIESEKNLGTDVSKANIKLEESKALSAQVSTDIESLKSLLEERYSENERDAKKREAKILVEKIKTDIKLSHEALKDVFKELRSASSASVDVEISTEINATNN